MRRGHSFDGVIGGTWDCRADAWEQVARSDAVDLVVSSYAFHHLGHDGKELAAAEALRVLRPGGRLVVVDMRRGRPAQNWSMSGNAAPGRR